MFYTYILKSTRAGKYYVGYTGDLEKRLATHNAGRVTATKRDCPWEFFYHENFSSEADAVRREQQLKSWKSRKALERLKFGNKIEDPRFHNRA